MNKKQISRNNYKLYKITVDCAKPTQQMCEWVTDISPVCRICKSIVVDTRFWVCRECAEAESIISSWQDMYGEWNAKTSMEKLEMLIEKWRKIDEWKTI